GAGASPYWIIAADLDGDTDQDLAVAGATSPGYLVILENNGDGTFAAQVAYLTNDYSVAVCAADLDGDGDADMAMANNYSNDISVLLNNGDATFAASVEYASGNSPKSVSAADLDGDGDQDLMAANCAVDNVAILMNNGDGTFAQAVTYATGDYPYTVIAADLDHDGDRDVAVTNYFSNTVSILLNNGDGTFATAVGYGAGYSPQSIVAADLDDDGDLDLATANRESSDVYILFNLTAPPSGVEEGETPERPVRFALSQNYPNPFNPETKIAFTVPKASAVKIEVFNLLGQRVRLLVDQYYPAGSYVTSWNGTDDAGSMAATGVYFYRFTAGDVTETKKMVLLK
ncbi:MAG: T9SS type A sorting domain-containing protein, partial [candidate division Zixibacteria bacterium]|nr:T9SS type A sorting domain-containing protein [candidate division Zixibacteria bacterium]